MPCSQPAPPSPGAHAHILPYHSPPHPTCSSPCRATVSLRDWFNVNPPHPTSPSSCLSCLEPALNPPPSPPAALPSPPSTVWRCTAPPLTRWCPADCWASHARPPACARRRRRRQLRDRTRGRAGERGLPLGKALVHGRGSRCCLVRILALPWALHGDARRHAACHPCDCHPPMLSSRTRPTPNCPSPRPHATLPAQPRSRPRRRPRLTGPGARRAVCGAAPAQRQRRQCLIRPHCLIRPRGGGQLPRGRPGGVQPALLFLGLVLVGSSEGGTACDQAQSTRRLRRGG
mgnify:CR=1 FL=1